MNFIPKRVKTKQNFLRHIIKNNEKVPVYLISNQLNWEKSSLERHYNSENIAFLKILSKEFTK